ncbi:hypothetical protein QWZ13_05800 [Reinekea marina]|uniref:hypothetical protein n=1 Tax=Reinekea marina TaxID=1310421 RepID=UPI0025B29A03|nr:hypothetical protein [Reinekea marina]MDN3648419.1 hypothetical protein [Reinekea marina]
MSALIFAVLSGNNPLDTLLFAYMIGFIPALLGCAVNWALYLVLRNKYPLRNFVIGLIGGIVLFLLLVVWSGVPNDATSIFAILLMFAVPSSVCCLLSLPHSINNAN